VIFDEEQFPAHSIITDPASCVSSSGKSQGLFFTPPSHIFSSSSDFSPPQAISSPTQVLADLTLHDIHIAPAVNSNEYHLHSSFPSLHSGQPESSESVPIPSTPTLSPSSDHHHNVILNLQNGALSTHEPSKKIITGSQTGHHKPRRFPDFHLYSTRHPLRALHAGLVCVESRFYVQAASIPEWCAVMDSEFQSLL